MKILVGSSLQGLLVVLVCLQSVCGDELSREHHLADQPASVVGPRAEFRGDFGNVDRLVADDQVVDGDSLSSPERRRADYDDFRQVRVDSGKHVLTPRTTEHLQNYAGQVDGSGAKADFPCPVAAAILPCVCYNESDMYIDLDCTLVESEEQLANVFQQEFPVKELREFRMENNNAIKVLGNILNGISFESVYINSGNFPLEEISEYFLLASKDSLTNLTIWNSQLTSDHFPFAVLAVMEKLQMIDIEISNITWISKILAPKISTMLFNQGKTEIIESGTFPIHAQSLELLMQNDEINTVEPGSFYFADTQSNSSNEGIYINLYGNRLKSLEAGTFVFRDGPMIVWLPYNKELASIAPGAFVMPPTTDFFTLELSLYNTQRKTFDEDVFGELMPYVTGLRLAKNPLLCGCDIAWLVFNADYMSVIDDGATCADGTNLHDLDPAFYETVC